MNFSEYENRASKTAIYPGKKSVIGIAYASLGLSGEAGEVAEKIKKCIRDEQGIMSDERRAALKKELGDCLWYLNAMAQELDLSLTEIAEANLEKLESRQERGTLQGSGDDR